MDEAKDKKQRRILVGIIVMLCVVAVGLGVGIGVKVASGGDDGQIADEGTSDNGPELSEKEEMYVYFDENMEELSAKVDEILAQDPNNGSAAKKVYTDYIDKYMLYGEEDLVGRCWQEGVDKLMMSGLNREALELLSSVDITYAIGIERCVMIFDAISLANSLGESEIVSKYELMATNISDGFGESCSDSSAAIDLYNDIVTERNNS